MCTWPPPQLRRLLAIPAITLAMAASGQNTYYVSPSGNDGNSGLTGSPWKTITRVNTAISSSLASGDEVLFEGGATYTGSIKVHNKSGISFGAVPSTGTPVIDGALPVMNTWNPWVDPIGNPEEYPIYRAELTLPHAPNAQAAHVYMEGERLTLARFPNTGFFFAGEIDDTSLKDDALTQGSGYWVGAEVVIRHWGWSYSKQPVTSFASSVLGFPALNGGVQDYNWGYFLCNKLEELDQAGEWYYDGTYLYVWALDDDEPEDVSVVVLYTHNDNDWENQGFDLQNANDITIDGFAIRHFAKSGVSCYISHRTTVRNCTIEWTGSGITSHGNPAIPHASEDHIYEDNTFRHVFDFGVNASGSRCIVEDNVFRDIALFPGEGENGYGYIGTRCSGTESRIIGNTYERIGYTAIEVGGGFNQYNPDTYARTTDAEIRNNYVTGALSILNDGAGIAFDNTDGLVVENNIVHDLSANLEQRLESSATEHYAYHDISYGIYFGNSPNSNAQVRGNVVSGCAAGIHVDHTHLSEENHITDNVLFNNGKQLSMSDASNDRTAAVFNGGVLYQDEYTDVYSGNILYGIHEDQRCIRQIHAHLPSDWDDLVDFGDFGKTSGSPDATKANFLFNAYTDMLIEVFADYSGEFTIPLTIDMWRDHWATQQESVADRISPIRSRRQVPDNISITDLVTNGTFDMDATSWQFNACAEHETDAGDYLNGPCLYSPLVQSPFPHCRWIQEYASNTAVPGAYVMEFTVRADEPTVLKACMHDDADPSGIFDGIWVYADDTPEGRTYTVPLTVASSAGEMYPFFDHIASKHLTPGGNVWLDDISLRPCSLITLDPNEDHILRYNCPLDLDANDPQNVTSFELEGCWADVRNNIYTGTVTLNEWESIVLYRLNGDLANLPLDMNDEYVISGTEVWDTNRNVEGSIVIEDGGTLIVDGAIIGFAETTGGLTTNIIVEAGGTLIVKNNGHLTSLVDCDDPVMWDGIRTIGGGMNPPIVEFTSGAKISNALTALNCGNAAFSAPTSGHTAYSLPDLTLTDAYFLNNQHGLVLPGPVFFIPSAGETVPATIQNTHFVTTRALNNPSLKPKDHVYLRLVKNLAFEGCTFANTSGVDPTDPTKWGNGIRAVNSSPLVVPLDEQRSTFDGLRYGVNASGFIANSAPMVDQADLADCAAGVYIVGLDNATVTSNTFAVPDADVSGQGVDAAYGAYIDAASGFVFEDNVFTGPGSGATNPTVGAVFNDTGNEANMYYNNRFDDFAGSGGSSAGTIIMGENDGSSSGDGLVIKCNDYSNTSDNDYDVAFTGRGTTIGDQQGSDANAQAPAGNTFATGCSGEQHFVNPEADIAQFAYWHHNPGTTAAQVVPECATDPPIIVSGGSSWYETTAHNYFKTTVCPSFQDQLLSMGDQMAEAVGAESSQSLSETSSTEAHYYQKKACAMHRLTTMALRGMAPEQLDSAIQAHVEHPLYTSARNLFGLYMAKGDTASAREILQVALEEDPGSVFWQVQALHLDVLAQNTDPAMATHLIAPLQELAATGGYGGGHARAWLAMLGAGQPEVIILPTPAKRLRQPEEVAAQRPTMQVFPNPSQGTVFVEVQVPEDAGVARLGIMDITGRMVREWGGLSSRSLVELALPLPDGVYLAVLFVDGSITARTKFQIMR
jgi:hypothetical protein